MTDTENSTLLFARSEIAAESKKRYCLLEKVVDIEELKRVRKGEDVTEFIETTDQLMEGRVREVRPLLEKIESWKKEEQSGTF